MFVAVAAGAGGFLYAVGTGDDPAIDRQPVHFSHELHAGRLKVECLFCHRHAEYSPVAGVPTVSLCMSCHLGIKATGSGMQELSSYWTNTTPIPWLRLQQLPDHVYFSHQVHVRSGMQCADCHGSVQTMQETPRAASFEMGWCVSCHAQRQASLDCWTCHK
jgi:hypothetical protein